MMEYEELRIRVRKLGAGRYLVMANGPAANADVIVLGDEPADYQKRFNQLIEVELGRAPMGEDPVTMRLRELGRDVFDVLLPPPLLKCLDESRKRAQGQRPAHGLRLRFDLPPELHDLPLETLTSPAASSHQSLALNPNLSLVRSLPGDTPGHRLPDAASKKDYIHLLVAVASPQGLPPLDAEAEVAALSRSLPDLTFQKTVMRGATRRSLEEWLGEHAHEPTAVLLIAHGAYDDTRQEGVVYLEAEDGTKDTVPGQLLSGMLVRAQLLRLVVLNLCAGARSTRFEPFSGLAQALVGRGVPAVVAMQDRVTNVAGTVLGPKLLERVSANMTIDEAVTLARQHVSNLPGHTTIEWTTPVLFLHQACTHGWLFKAREVRDDHDKVVDPLHDGEAALQRYESPGDVSTNLIVKTARYLRIKGEWSRVLSIAQAGRRPSKEQQQLIDEAKVELVWPEVEKLCELLTKEGDPNAARDRLAGLREQLPAELFRCLATEIEHAEQMAGLAGQARQAEAHDDWRTALNLYDQVISARPGGFRDVIARREAARAEVALIELYEAAGQHRLAERWAKAAEAYAEIISRRAGFRDTERFAAYVSARLAEDAANWVAAAEAYGTCADFQDAAARMAYAQGRAAVGKEHWVEACDAFATAVDLGVSDDWLWYTYGRAAEQASAWPEAVEAYERVPEFQDAALRLLLARQQQAVDDSNWPAAYRLLHELDSHGWDVADLLAKVNAEVLEDAHEAEEAGSWDLAVTLYRMLPEDEAVRTHCRYAEARVAELAGDWQAAAGLYHGTEYVDAAVRMTYCLGRICEHERKWDQARAHFEALPAHLLDASDRLLYVAGRAADERADWPGVIKGFDRLPDSYEQGDVGARRRFARACIAAEKGDWGSVLASLAQLSDEDRDGAVGVLRGKAGGKQAEAVGDWERAVAEYRPFADTLGALCYYAQGRACEAGGQWAEAIEAYHELPDEHEDVVLRRAYAQARLAERDASDKRGWQSCVEAYEAIPDEIADSAKRLGYARARLAEASGDWAAAVSESEALASYLDSVEIACYARGRLAEETAAWDEALHAYESCAGRADAADRSAYAKARVLESKGRYSAAIDAYALIPSGFGDAGDRRRRLVRLCEALPWADGLTGAALVADPFASRDNTFPYLALRDVGVTPGSSAEVVNAAAYALMERGGMSFQERVAWDRLRSAEKRLQLDALLYQFRDPAALREQLAGLPPGDRQEMLDELCKRLPAEAPQLILLTRSRDEAIEAWQQLLAEDPGDMAVVHSLAVAYFWRAQELEDSGAWELAVLAWERALACWAALLTDDEHWSRWRQARAECYGHAVTPADIARLRWELGQNLFKQLSSHAERHAGRGRLEHSGTYQELSHLLEMELEGARALKEAGGLPVGGHTLACGQLYLHMVHLEERLGALVVSIEGSRVDGMDPGELALRRLRCAFSELAPSLTFTEHHRFEQALRALPAFHQTPLAKLPADCDGPSAARNGHVLDCERCQEMLRDNPAYTFLPHRRARLLQDAVDLAVRAHFAIARTDLTGGGRGIPGAMAEWAAAIRISGNAAMAVRTKQAVLRMVLGRAEALADEEDNRLGQSLDEAITLVESAVELLGPLEREPLMGKLAALLTDRGIWNGYGCADAGFQLDMVRAEADLRRALALNPESARARDNLTRCLVFGLPGTPGYQTFEGKLKLLHEALVLLDDGLDRTPGLGRFRDTMTDALEELESLLLSDLSIAQLGQLLEDIGSSSPDAGGDETTRVRELAAEANEKAGRGDVSGAIRDLVRVIRLDPESAHYRRALISVVERKLEGKTEE